MGGLAKGLDLLSGALSGLSRKAADYPTTAGAATGMTVAAILRYSASAFGIMETAAGNLLKSPAIAAGGEAVSGAARVFGRILAPEWLVAAFVKDAADKLDPNGNFWGLTTPIDNFFKRWYGFDPSNLGAEVPAPPEPKVFDLKAWRAGIAADRARALSPDVDTSAIDKTSQKAKQAGDDLKALGAATVAPKVDSGALDAALAKLREMASLIGTINGGLSGISRRASYAGALHDGPEAR